jgi:hypothetical protein
MAPHKGAPDSRRQGLKIPGRSPIPRRGSLCMEQLTTRLAMPEGAGREASERLGKLKVWTMRSNG